MNDVVVTDDHAANHVTHSPVTTTKLIRLALHRLDSGAHVAFGKEWRNEMTGRSVPDSNEIPRRVG
ncbi:hypothetical protein GCM10023156_10960 [Novipirellula rosea]|uniref:Uncharacterized protein n=1 Tax=Novipirellula rosea TaxID=1031540 RepID=A0ABP8MC08_9BACT